MFEIYTYSFEHEITILIIRQINSPIGDSPIGALVRFFTQNIFRNKKLCWPIPISLRLQSTISNVKTLKKTIKEVYFKNFLCLF